MTDKVILEIEPQIDSTKLKGTFRKVEEAGAASGSKIGKSLSKSFGGTVGKSFKSVFGGIFGALTGQVAALGASLGAAFAARGILKAGATIERLETQFGVLLGSASAAQKQIQSLTDFAARTPFRLEGLADASAGLLAFGFESDTLIDRLEKIGDVASGSNSDLKEVALIYGQVSAAGKLTGERLLQLQERAIPIGSALAKSLGVAESQVKSLVSSGKVGFKEFEEAFNSLSAAGGLFEGATSAQSKTIGGLLSTLSDNFFALQAAIAKAFGPIFKEILARAITIIQGFTVSFKNNSAEIVRGTIEIARGLNDFVLPALVGAKRVGEIVFRSIVVGINTIVAGVGQLGSALGKLLQFAGVGDELSNSLVAFGETSAIVLEESIVPLNDALGQIFEPIAFQEKTDQFLSTLEETVGSAKPLLEDLGNTGVKVAEKTANAVKKTSVDIGKAVSGALVKTISSSIQTMTKALVLGEGGFGSFAKNIAAIMGELAIQLGEMFLASGVAIEATKSLGGTGAIIAGAALIAVGTILSSLSGGAGTGGGGTGGGGGVATSGFGGDSFATEQVEEREEPSTSVAVNIQGDVLDSEESGLRIVGILNDAFDKEGVVVNSGVIG